MSRRRKTPDVPDSRDLFPWSRSGPWAHPRHRLDYEFEKLHEKIARTPEGEVRRKLVRALDDLLRAMSAHEVAP